MASTASYKRITVQPVAGALGAAISGVDLAQIDDETFDEIVTAWKEHLVIFFRDQRLSPDQQIAFSKRFGEIHYHPFIKGMDEHPEILELIKEENATKTFGSTWHTDQMFNPKPAKATILYAKETPDVGGDTMFANGYLAYETLSDGMKALCDTLKTWNVGDRDKLQAGDTGNPGVARGERYKNNPAMAAKVLQPPKEQQTETAHPLVRTHPETGRKALYIGNHTQNLEGFDPKEAKPILDYLKAHAVQPELTCRFAWQPRSLAIWDNRCTQHKALNDYPGKRRRMHRITIAGDAPY
jgi:taurine dioxygenase